MLIRNLFDNILEIVFPKRCFYCNKVGEIICDSCMKKIQNSYMFKKVNNDYFDYVYCSTYYKGNIKTQIHNFKFHEKAYLYQYFVEMALREKEISDFLKAFDIITYVPMYVTKEQKRGYNQAKLLANELGKKLNIKVIDCLEKKIENKTQSSLSEQERLTNVQDVFDFVKNRNISGKNIILVDDILTTGATVKNCSKILKENNAGKICIFAISKTK